MSPDYGLQFIYNINLIVSVLFCTIAIYFSFEKEPNIIVMTVFSALPATPALYCYYKIKRMPLLDDDYIQDQITAGRKLFLEKTYGEILEEIKLLNGSTFLPEKKRLQILDDVRSSHTELIDFIHKSAPSLTDDDVNYYLFCCLDLRNSSISACMAVSEDALRKRKSRIRKKLSDELSEYIFDSGYSF